MNYGVQYYPEHWPEDRWPIDAAMMRGAAVNTVRMGEFAWSAYEPAEGTLRFDWMDRALDLLHRHGVRTILCTCSRTPPPWVFAKYPSIVNHGPDNRPANPEGRYRIGLGHPEFIDLSQRIDRALIEHFAGNPAILGWQIDNEIGSGNDCFCDRCVGLFREYLKQKYGTIDRLNAAWGSHFWSLHFSSFDHVPRPGSSPQLRLEYRRFLSRLNCDFTRWRTDLIHQLDPGKWVTTNLQNIRTDHTSARDLIAAIDQPGCNNYPQRTPELMLDYYRGRHGTLHVLEQFARLQFADAGEGLMGLWAWAAIAHGAATITHFRWRCCRWGNEQFADGLLPHSGHENRRYRELARVGAQLAQVGPLIDRTTPRGTAAIVYGYDSRWAVSAGLFPKSFDPVEEAIAFHEALKRRNVPTDAMDPREDLSPYRLVIAPRLWLVDDAAAANLRRYVERGGTLCLTTGSGVVDQYGKSFDAPRPGPLADLAGLHIDDLAWIEDQTLALESPIIPNFNPAHAHLAADELHPTTAQPIATHATGWRTGQPAITRNALGRGQVIYLGTLLRPDFLQPFTDWLCAQSQVAGLLETPPGVCAYQRVGPDFRLLFLLNYTDQPHALDLSPTLAARDAFSDQPLDRMDIAPTTVRLIIVR